MNEQQFNIGIKILQDRLNMQLSDEQIAILKYNYRTPVLLNACAGAGKTTILIISMLMQRFDNVPLNHILGITFSRKARAGMATKFDQDRSLVAPTSHETPKFSTFDAFFLDLLKVINPHVRVLSTSDEIYRHIRYQMTKAIVHQSNIFDNRELVDKILEFRALLINRGYSYDGIQLLNGQQGIEAFKDLESDLGMTRDDTFYENYFAVIETYNRVKNQNGLVDFDDIKTQLAQALEVDDLKRQLKQHVNYFQRAFVDEFQDVNPMQWKLLRGVLSDEALAHLAVIGDDDQTIYDWRGSDPEIIMTLQQKDPRVKQMNLTINYRTAGEVLRYVSPMIQKNQYRLNKPLNIFTGNQSHGKLICLRSHGEKSGQELILDQVLKKAQDPTVTKSEIAILCRNNLDIATASDYLMDHDQLVNVNKRGGILQYHPIFKTLTELLRALVEDDFAPILENSNKIGFSRYRRHVEAVVKHYQKSHPIVKVSDYADVIKQYDQKHLNINDFHDAETIEFDDQVVRALNLIQVWQKNSVDLIGPMASDLITGLVSTYYRYMTKNNFVSKNDYKTMLYIFTRKLRTVDDLEAFLAANRKRAKLLLNVIYQQNVETTNPDKINLLTIHTSKGLEFDYVFLYNFRANQMTGDQIYLNQMFAPNISRAAFLDKLLNLDEDEVLRLSFDDQLGELIENLQGMYNVLSDDPKTWGNMRHQLIETPYQAVKHRGNLVLDFITAYLNVKTISMLVEDERRLVYVGLTRSRKEAYYNEDHDQELINTTPLYQELTTPKEHILIQNDAGKLMPVTDLYAAHGYTEADVKNFDQYFK